MVPRARLSPPLDKARADLNHALDLYPKESHLYLLLSRLEIMAGHPEKATASLKQGLQKVPGESQAEIVFKLADQLIDQGSLSEVGPLLARLRERNVAPRSCAS